MKTIFSIFFLLMSVALTLPNLDSYCSSSSNADSAMSANQTKVQVESKEARLKTLVAYFSKSGTTKKVAMILAQDVGADVVEISEKVPVEKGILGALQYGYQALFQQRPEVSLTPGIDPANYARILVGTPVWMGSISSPIRTFLTKHVDPDKQYGLFYTCGGIPSSNLRDRLTKQVNEATRHSPLAVVGVQASEVHNSDGWRENMAVFK